MQWEPGYSNVAASVELAGVIAAGAIVLLALGCFAQDIYDFAEAGSSSSDAKYESSSALNVVGGIGALYAISLRADGYLNTCRNLLNYGFKDIEDMQYYMAGGNSRYRGWSDTSPILVELGIVELFSLLTGFGTPYDGSDLKDGSEQLSELHEQLNLTFPDNGWGGGVVSSLCRRSRRNSECRAGSNRL